jgi:hypothetical protein
MKQKQTKKLSSAEILAKYNKALKELRPYGLYVNLVKQRSLERVDKIEKQRRFCLDKLGMFKMNMDCDKFKITHRDYDIASRLLAEPLESIQKNAVIHREALANGMDKITAEIRKYFFQQ